jgi:urea transport system permease protein
MRRLLLCLALSLSLPARPALAALDPTLVKQLADEDSDQKIAAVQKLTALADPAALPVLSALAADGLALAGDRVVIIDGERILDAATGAPVVPAPESTEPITVNNRVRRELTSALAALRLFDVDPKVRLDAAQKLASEATLETAPLLERALVRETDPKVKKLLTLAYGQSTLGSPDAAVRLKAVKALGASGSASVKNLLTPLLEERAEPDAGVRRAAKSSIASIDARLIAGDVIARVFSGLSLGTIFLLAALGLAITYGVMGVINMAHGELLMIGAYATYAVQGVFQRRFPVALDFYLVAAIPVAFVAAALVGVLLERTVIRFLYGRPLETLLATWGLSLFLIQAARMVFGAQNVEVANPSWMSGGIELIGGAVLPWNRIVIIAFSLGVLTLLWLVLNRTRLGLFVRAVTQNRAMAGCVGVPTGRVDALAFGLGAGIAGLGGVALSQISNVGPDMGQGYIVDSFMVVVLGGVGQLAGAAWAALGLGVAAKFLEGWAGAVIAKILVLVFIIIFIQKRPQGLFALKGRTVES